jgi:hypothetical protein
VVGSILLRRFAPAAAVVLLLGACRDAGLTPPAAVVDGTAITQADLAREVDVFLAVTPDQRTATNRKEDLNRGALAFLIQQELVERYASRKGIVPDQQLLTGSLQQTLQAAGGQAALAKQLAARHLTLADVRAFVRQVAVRQAIGAALSSDVNQQAQAFSTWLLGVLKSADVDVNPRFGTLDRQSGQVHPVTSTDQLS